MRIIAAGAVLAGCSLIAGLLVSPPVAAAPGTPAAPTVAQEDDPFAGSFNPVDGNPVRVLDTRTGLGGRLGAVAPRQTVTAPVRAGSQDPTAPVVIKVTVPGNAPTGSLSVYPSGTTWNGHVTMSLVGGSTISQQLTVRPGRDGGVTVRNNSARAVHLIVEALGYYDGGTPSGYGTFVALDTRILDTRATGPLNPGRKLTVALPGHFGVPAGGVTGAVLNVSVLSARANGLLGVTDGDGSQATLHMRFAGNRTGSLPMQTERMVRVGADGKLTFSQSSTAGVHLVVDLMGYFRREGDGPYQGVFAGRYVPLSPRPISLRRQYGTGTQLKLIGHQPLPLFPGIGDFTQMAFTVVVSADQPSQPTLLGLYDSGSPWTPTVTLSSTAARQPTELIVHASLDGWITLVNLSSAPQTNLHAYLTGYYWYNHCVACLRSGS